MATTLRNLSYDRGWSKSHRADVPVISVGNLTLGGTGKTPCVETIARFYRELDLMVVILSRGYGSQGGRNDEALVLEANLPDVPHLQGQDRVALAHTAVEELEAEVLILDDGFQHRRLARQLDIVLIDVTQPWKHARLFPRGLLRESRRSLQRATLVMLTRCDRLEGVGREQFVAEVRQYYPTGPIVQTTHEPLELVGVGERTELLESLQCRRVVAFCGIGNPEAFRRTLTNLGVDLIDFRTYPDHHPYGRDDVMDLQSWASKQADEVWVLTTQKDFVKIGLPDLGGRLLWAVKIGLRFLDGQDAFEECLRGVIAV